MSDLAHGEEICIAHARAELANRKAAVLEFFSASIARSPAWDMLLDLYLASLANQSTQTTHLLEEASVSRATGLRLLDRLEQEGFIRRFRRPGDNRSRFVSLSEQGKKLLDAYFQMHPKKRKLNEPDQVAAQPQSDTGISAFDW